MPTMKTTRLHLVWTVLLACSLIGTQSYTPIFNPKNQYSNDSPFLEGIEFASRRQLRSKIEQCTYINSDGVKVTALPAAEPATQGAQVASEELAAILHLDISTKRPIWTKDVIAELDRIVASGASISCPHYPHSAEDIALAVRHIGLDMSKIVVGVVSSISPWVEHVLRAAGSSHVVTIDYNEPIVCSGISWIESKSVPQFGAEEGVYDLLVSFSGIEHSGLGRYGDPLNENGDVEAIQNVHKALAPGGILLLAIPTMHITVVQGNSHRIYGPDRLALLLENRFAFVGRVWNGHIFNGGWSDVRTPPKLFPTQDEADVVATWMNQHVLILQKLPDVSVYHVREMNTPAVVETQSGSQLMYLTPLVILIAFAVRFVGRRAGKVSILQE